MVKRANRLVIAVLAESYSPRMGYIQNALPKYLARLGAEVHLLTEDILPYSQQTGFEQIYGDFMRTVQLTPGTVEAVNGFTLHVLAHKKILGYLRMEGMFDKLKLLRPHVVQAPAAVGWIPMDAALWKTVLGYKLFTGNHTHASVFPLAQMKKIPWRQGLRTLLLYGVPGRLVSWFTEKCYSTAVDCAEVATRFFGVRQATSEVCPLGVDTDVFRPAGSSADMEARSALRRELGFSEDEIVCVYSGRFGEDKDPLILARAIEQMRKRGLPYRGLFLGGGPQSALIQSCDGCIIRPFVPFYGLRPHFQAAEIGVWPKQESLSMLDAAACGIPIVVNDTLRAVERISGNGVMYRSGDVDDMVRVLTELKDAGKRERLGACGAARMRSEFSWEVIARRRLKDYMMAVGDTVTC